MLEEKTRFLSGVTLVTIQQPYHIQPHLASNIPQPYIVEWYWFKISLLLAPRVSSIPNILAPCYLILLQLQHPRPVLKHMKAKNQPRVKQEPCERAAKAKAKPTGVR